MNKKSFFVKLCDLLIVLILAITTQLLTAKAQTCSDTITTPTSDFIILGNGTVAHKSTGLMWQQCSEGQTYSNGGCSGELDTFTQSHALQRPAEVNAGIAGTQYGYTDWRLPDIDELASIVENGCTSPAINVTVFPGTPPYLYWSSTQQASYLGGLLSISFKSGIVGTSSIESAISLHVRLVRDSGGEIFTTTTTSSSTTTTSSATTTTTTTIPPTTYIDNGNGTLTAVVTELTWQKGNDGFYRHWDEANTYCDDMSLAGLGDWRLPSIDELKSLIDLAYTPTINPAFADFPSSSGTASNFWSSTVYTANSGEAWYVHFYDGTVDKGTKGWGNLVRCVRSGAITTTTANPTTTSTTSTSPSSTTTTIISILDQHNSTIRIYTPEGTKQDYYSVNDEVKLDANYRDQEGLDVDVTGVANWVSSNGLIADVGNGVSKGGSVTFKGNGEVRIFSFLNGLMDYMDFKVGSADIAKHHGNLIILAGGKSNDVKDALKESIQYLCNRIYQVFKVRMFKDEDIYYINHKTDQDFNGDGVVDGIVDQSAKSVQALTQAIQWAKTQSNDGPLYLYLVDHGEKNGTFLVDSNQVLSAAQLNVMLTDFESTGRTTVVILEACYSGSFVASLAGPHRVIITSANSDKYSFIGAGGKVSFDQFFSNYLMVGKSWVEAFDLTVEDMKSLGVPYSTMMPQKSIGAQVTMGKIYGDFTMASLFPEMKTYTPGASVVAQTANDFSVQLDITSTKDVEVWGMITPPNYQPPTVTEEFGTPVVNLDKIVLTPPDGSKDFTGQYTFPCGGAYSVTYYAKDINGMVVSSPPQTFTVSGTSCDFTTQIAPSWNLLSLPVTPVDPAIDKVLAQVKDSMTSAWKWENGTWAVYLPGETDGGASYASSKSFGKLSTLDPGEGFWVNSSAGIQLTIPGAPATGELTFASGWNLVGLKGSKAATVAEVTATHPQLVSMWKWEKGSWAVYLPDETSPGAYAAAKGFGVLNTINPGEGFWMNMPEI